MTNRECRKWSRCNNFRECETCALVRNYKIAEVIRQRVPLEKTVTYAVIKPINQKLILKIRKRLSRIITTKADGHMWAIKEGEMLNQLRIHFIIAGNREITQEDIPNKISQSTDTWAEEIPNSNLETVTKFILNPKSIPKVTKYTGNTYGRAGIMAGWGIQTDEYNEAMI